MNLNDDLSREKSLAQLRELEEMRLDAFKSSKNYNERAKRLYDQRIIMNREFKVGDRVLLFNSRAKLFPRKHKSMWSRPFEVV